MHVSRPSVMRCLLAVAMGMAIACGPTAAQSPSASAPPSLAGVPEHRIGVRVVDGVGELFDRRTGERFVVRGANEVFVPGPDGAPVVELFRVGSYDAARIRADLAALAARGYNTVRIFLDHCGSGPGCIGDTDGFGLTAAYLDNVADLLAAAAEAGLVVMLTSNDLPDDGGYSAEANAVAGPAFAGYRNAFYLTPQAVSATRRYWRDIVTGLIARGAPTDAVLAYELVNEQWMFQDQPPLSLTSGSVTTTTGTYDMADPQQKKRMVADGLVAYADALRAEIRSHDPTALVTMGFFLPGVAPGWYTDPAPLLERSTLDLLDFHAYPGPLSVGAHARHFGMLGHPEKPVLMGEYGAFRFRYATVEAAARALVRWVADSCRAGFDGWLYWTYRPAAPSAGDRTWGLIDRDGFLADLLSPRDHPDPCVAAEVPTSNRAFGRPVRTSASLAGQPGKLAVDDDVATRWNAGGGPVQWIEVELDGPTRVAEIRLLAAQFPAGRTRHQVAIRARGSRRLRPVHTFAGLTREGDWLVYRPASPLRGVTAVRVTTLASPSWVAWKEVVVRSELPR